MKNIIKKILKEALGDKQDNFERYVIKTLKDEGFNPSTNYSQVLKFINSSFGISGMEAFQLYQLFLDNFKTSGDYTELIRKDLPTKKIRTANSTGRELVSNKIPFQGSNTHANYERNVYVVYSYGWYPIFVYKDGQWFENENRYSISTAKQMSQLRPHGQGEIIKLGREGLNKIIYGR